MMAVVTFFNKHLKVKLGWNTEAVALS